MQILVNNIYSHIRRLQPQQKHVIHKALSIQVPNYRFMPQYRRGQWDGTKKFFHAGSGAFLTGLLPFILRLAREHRFPVRLVDQRAPRPLAPLWEVLAYPLLREYQKSHLSGILRLTEADSAGQTVPWLRGIIKHPTGAGKTYFAAALMLALRRRTLFVVGRRDLLYQTQAVFERQLKRKIGVIGDSKSEIRAVTVGTVQTIAPRLRDPAMLDYLSNVDVLMFDEAHHVAAGQYHDIAVRCPAYFRFGFSASPLSRGDTGDVTLIAHTGEIISELDRKALEDTGWLSKALIQLKTISEPRIPPRAPYPLVYEQGIVKHAERNALIVEAAVAACTDRGDTTLILVRRKAHGNALRRACQAAGLPTVYLQGASSMEKRKTTLAKMRMQHLGTPFVVVATTIFDEGIDAPDIRCLILAGGGASRIKSIQRVGRGLRPKSDGPNTLTVIDFVDQTHRFLAQHSSQRLAAYAQEGFTVTYE